MSDTRHYKCHDCGNLRGIGLWYDCPHGKPYGQHSFHEYIDEHIAEQPVLITSKAQRDKLMKQNKLDYRGKKVGDPGCMI